MATKPLFSPSPFPVTIPSLSARPLPTPVPVSIQLLRLLRPNSLSSHPRLGETAKGEHSPPGHHVEDEGPAPPALWAAPSRSFPLSRRPAGVEPWRPLAPGSDNSLWRAASEALGSVRASSWSRQPQLCSRGPATAASLGASVYLCRCRPPVLPTHRSRSPRETGPGPGPAREGSPAQQTAGGAWSWPALREAAPRL